MAVHGGLAVIDEGTAISKEVVSEDTDSMDDE